MTQTKVEKTRFLFELPEHGRLTLTVFVADDYWSYSYYSNDGRYERSERQTLLWANGQIHGAGLSRITECLPQSLHFEVRHLIRQAFIEYRYRLQLEAEADALT